MAPPLRIRLRRLIRFLKVPVLIAIGLTLVVRLFFSSSKPKSDGYSKALVVATTQDTFPKAAKWLAKVPAGWTIHRYATDLDPTAELTKKQRQLGLRPVVANKGHEAMAYLTYIVDHYHALPDVVFFHRDKRHARYQDDVPAEEQVANLRSAYVVAKGYASARCVPECENVVELPDKTVDFDAFRYHGREVHLATLIRTFLHKEEEMPTKLAAPCCSQFAASREAIHRRPLDWWKRLRQWLVDAPLDSASARKLMEQTWHLWLGEKAE